MKYPAGALQRHECVGAARVALEGGISQFEILFQDTPGPAFVTYGPKGPIAGRLTPARHRAARSHLVPVNAKPPKEKLGGLRPREPPYGVARGAPCPAPLRRLARSCSLVSWPRGPATLDEQLVPINAKLPKEKLGGLRPREPPYGVARGAPLPRSAPPTRSLLLARSWPRGQATLGEQLVPSNPKPPRTRQGEAASYQSMRSLLVPISAKPRRTNRKPSYQSMRSLLVPSSTKPPRTKRRSSSYLLQREAVPRTLV